MTRSIGLLTAAVAIGCGEASGSAAEGARDTVVALAPAERDSAGITILEHPAGALERAPRLTVDHAPMVTIAGSADDMEADISPVIPQLLLEDGRLVGFDRQRQVVVIFSADGSDRQEFGRRGAGPGEYSWIESVIRLNDTTLLVHDAKNARASLLDVRTGPGREYSLAKSLGLGAGNPIGIVRQSLLIWGSVFGTDAMRLKTPVGVKGVVLDLADGTARHAFGKQPEERTEARARLGAGAKILLAAKGIDVLTTYPGAFGWQGGFAVTDGNHLRVELHNADGALRSIIAIAQPGEPLTEAIWEVYVSERLQSMRAAGKLGPGPAAIAEMRQRLNAGRRPDTLPVFERMHVTPDGTLWVVDHPVPGRDGWAATAIAMDGRIRGRIVEDMGDAPVAFSDDRVAFRTENELGIATLSVHRLRVPAR
jgi:hypothetical protein